jgi:aminoglycoside phosphotransferase (APT) family kinase protein
VGAVNAGVVTSVDQLSPEWLSRALGTEVRRVTVEQIGTGQTSSTYRLELDADDVPTTMVAKLAEGEEAARRRVVLAHRSEVGFYTRLSERMALSTPRCFYGSITEDGSSFTLLLEDLAPRRPGRQVEGCSPEQAIQAVRTVAALHAASWQDPSSLELDFVIPLTRERAEFLGGLVRTSTVRFIERFGDRLGAQDPDTLEAMAEAIVDWQLSRPQRFSLIHGDFRLDNLMFSPGGDGVVAVDWQTLTVAFPARDLSYFLGTALQVEDRRVNEQQLVDAYHDELLSRGVAGYSATECFEDYRLAQLHGPMITVLGVMTSAEALEPEAEEMFISMATRTCAAIRDLGSLSLIGA